MDSQGSHGNTVAGCAKRARLVADSLERRWNEKLTELAKAEEEYARAVKAEDPDLSPAARERIHALVSDLPRVGNDACTPARERKRILRLLIEDVTLVRDREIHLHIRWKGGATTSMELPLSARDLHCTSATVVELIRALATRRPIVRLPRLSMPAGYAREPDNALPVCWCGGSFRSAGEGFACGFCGR
jgi:hypothetical protein